MEEGPEWTPINLNKVSVHGEWESPWEAYDSPPWWSCLHKQVDTNK